MPRPESQPTTLLLVKKSNVQECFRTRGYHDDRYRFRGMTMMPRSAPICGRAVPKTWPRHLPPRLWGRGRSARSSRLRTMWEGMTRKRNGAKRLSISQKHLPPSTGFAMACNVLLNKAFKMILEMWKVLGDGTGSILSSRHRHHENAF